MGAVDEQAGEFLQRVELVREGAPIEVELRRVPSSQGAALQRAWEQARALLLVGAECAYFDPRNPWPLDALEHPDNVAFPHNVEAFHLLEARSPHEPHGVLVLSWPVPSALSPHQRRLFPKLGNDAVGPLCWIEYLAVAPWNLPASSLVAPEGDPRRLRGVGSALRNLALRVALVRKAQTLALHAQSKLAHETYVKSWQFNDLGSDLPPDDYPVCELPRSTWAAWLRPSPPKGVR